MYLREQLGVGEPGEATKKARYISDGEIRGTDEKVSMNALKFFEWTQSYFNFYHRRWAVSFFPGTSILALVMK